MSNVQDSFEDSIRKNGILTKEGALDIIEHFYRARGGKFTRTDSSQFVSAGFLHKHLMTAEAETAMADLRLILLQTDPSLQADLGEYAAWIPRDGRLVGRWHKSESHRSGDFSVRLHWSRVLAGDGRFAEGGNAFSDSVSRNESGAWAGLTSLAVGSADHSGWWIGTDGTLTLQWDSGGIASFRYRLGDSSLMLTSPNGDRDTLSRG